MLVKGAPGVARSWAAMVLSTEDKRVAVFSILALRYNFLYRMIYFYAACMIEGIIISARLLNLKLKTSKRLFET